MRLGLTPVVVNALSLRRFAQSLGRRAKTDHLDAELLAHYGRQLQPSFPRPVPAETARQDPGAADRPSAVDQDADQ